MSDSNELKCPICGSNIEIIENARYCEHIAFIYCLLGADDDFWLYVSPGFAGAYTGQIKNNTVMLKNQDFDIPSADHLNKFTQCEFEPADEISAAFPYVPALITGDIETPVEMIKYELEYYSGVEIGVYPG